MKEPQGHIFYHGTAALYEARLIEEGLIPCRQSGGVYITPVWERAKAYAVSWAVGLHAVGEAASIEAVIFRIDLPKGIMLGQEQIVDFGLPRPITPDEIIGVDRVDCSGLSEEEQAGYLGNFIGIVSWDYDAYGDNRFEEISKKAVEIFREIPESVKNEGLLKVPLF